jgi:hypothetical protein
LLSAKDHGASSGRRVRASIAEEESMSFNPYAPPQSDAVEMVDRSKCRREGLSVIYVADGGDLPLRCVKCNAPAKQPVKKRTFYWHASGWYLLILFNLIIYAVVASIVRKKVQLSPGLCAAHSNRRNQLRYGSLAVFLLALVSGIAAIGQDSGLLAAISIVVALVALIVCFYGSRTVYPVRIDERGTRLKGFGREFLDSFQRQYPN